MPKLRLPSPPYKPDPQTAQIQASIELVIIDSSSMKHFITKAAQKYIDIIDQLITQKLGSAEGT